MRVDIGDVLEGVFKSDRYKNMWLVWRYKTETKAPLGNIPTNWTDLVAFFVIDMLHGAASWVNGLLFARELKKVELDPWDISHMDISLAAIIVPALKELQLRNVVFIDVDPMDIPSSYAGTPSSYVLDEMIFAFSYTANENADTVPVDGDRIMRGRILFAKYFDQLWD